MKQDLDQKTKDETIAGALTIAGLFMLIVALTLWLGLVVGAVSLAVLLLILGFFMNLTAGE